MGSFERERTVRRPFGITVLAILFVAAGISYLMLGFQLTTAVTFGPLPAGQGTWIWGWLLVLTGLAFLAGGLAAWRLERWGWGLGHFLAILGILEAIFALLGTGNLNYALATTAFPFLLLWYLNRPSVKLAFGLADE
jgi:cytochrome c oxidase subunit IV